MIETPPQDHRSTTLDHGLLSAPYKIQTNWHVITGAPCSGKTTLINRLAKQGFQTIPESARFFIEREMAVGQVDHPIHINPAALQRSIRGMQMKVEAGLSPDDVLFLDGAVPGSLAWYRVYGLDPNEILPDCFQHHYASVFILAPLPFRKDEERVPEMDAIAGYLDDWHTRDYIALGYPVVRVPVLPPETRLAFVLERLAMLERDKSGRNGPTAHKSF